MLGDQAGIVDLACAAMNANKKLNVVYAAEGAEQPGERTVQVHDVVSFEGRFYLIAWCERAGGWRRFRCDRVLDAAMCEAAYEPRSDTPLIEGGSDLFDPPRPRCWARRRIGRRCGERWGEVGDQGRDCLVEGCKT
jgi:proteasome accessory factor C